MSELKQSLKKAIRTFTHASDFAVPLHEDAYLIAEDINDEIVAERNFHANSTACHLEGRSFWQTDRKRCPAVRFALDLDLATMGLDNSPGDR